MKRWILALVLVMLCVVSILAAPHEAHEAGSIRIPASGIVVEVYTTGHAPDCAYCGTLWNGDKVTHNGKTWVSTTDGNVWEPGYYGWEEIV